MNKLAIAAACLRASAAARPKTTGGRASSPVIRASSMSRSSAGSASEPAESHAPARTAGAVANQACDRVGRAGRIECWRNIGRERTRHRFVAARCRRDPSDGCHRTASERAESHANAAPRVTGRVGGRPADGVHVGRGSRCRREARCGQPRQGDQRPGPASPLARPRRVVAETRYGLGSSSNPCSIA